MNVGPSMTFDLVLVTAYLICGALMLFMGFVVLRENPGQRVNRATAGMLVFGGLGPILGAVSSFGVGPVTGGRAVVTDFFAEFAFLWEFYFPCVLLFALVFPSQHRLVKRFPRLPILLFMPHVFHVLLVLLTSEATHLGERLDPSHWAPWGEGVLTRATAFLRITSDLLLRIHVRFFSFVNFSMAVMSSLLLWRSIRKTLNPKLKSQVRTIAHGLSFSLGLYSGGELLPRVLGMEMARAVRLPLVTFSLLVGAISIVVAIVRLQFLDVRFIVRRGLVYGLASGGIVAVYLFAGKQMDRWSSQLTGQTLPVFETTFVVLSLFLLQPVLAGIEAMVDGTYSRDRKDLRNTLTRLSEEVSLLLEPAQVRSTVAATLRREMVLKSAAVVSAEGGMQSCPLVLARSEVEVLPHWTLAPSIFLALQGRRESIRAKDLPFLLESEEERAALARDLEDWGIDLVFPMHAMTREQTHLVVGALLLGGKLTETRMTFEEISLAGLVAHQVGISLVNGALHRDRVTARLLEEEVATARKIQRNLLPEAAPRIAGWSLCASNRSSRDVGGDYYDFLPLPDGHLGIAIGDVSGKGIPAALLMSNLQAALRVHALAGHSTQRLVHELNRHIFRTTGAETFISFFLGELEPESGSFVYSNAGHNAPFLVREDGRVETLDRGGLLLGVFPEVSYERGHVEMAQGDLLVMYTDGASEASDENGEMYTDDRIRDKLIELRQLPVDTIHDRLLEDIRLFQCGRPLDDDLTLILLKYTQSSVAAPEEAGRTA